MRTLDQLRSQLGSKTMQNLPPEVFAEQNGLADQFIQEVDIAKLKPTQLRRIFHMIKDMQRDFHKDPGSFNRGKIALVIPQIAYAYGRDLIPKDFFELLVFCLGPERCSTKEDFDSAANFLEAIMAYHKYYSKK